MKRYIYLLMVMLVMPIIFISCIKDEDEQEASEICYISKVTLGSLKRTMYMKTTAGMDSIYTTTFSGSYFPLSIDQRAETIENHDSLPNRTRLDAVLTTITFEGLLYWRKAQLADGEDTTWTAYNSKDSLDLSQPLHLRVTSASGLSNRTYTLHINVHQQRGDSTVWNNMGELVQLEGIGERSIKMLNGKLTIWGKKDDGSMTCLQRQESGEWTSEVTTGTDGADPTTLQTMSNAAYMSTASGAIITSIDGKTWTNTSYPTQTGLRLVGASNDFLYGLQNQKLLCSNGGGWTEELLDEGNENLPTEELNCVYYTAKNGMERLMLIGSRNATDTSATIWSKTWESGKESVETWIYYTPNATDIYPCPIFQDLCILPYDDGLQALGGKSRDGQYTALKKILHSADHGISWQPYLNDDMLVDEELQAAAQQATHISACADDDQYLWIVVDNKAWRGRINRLGFLRQDK